VTSWLCVLTQRTVQVVYIVCCRSCILQIRYFGCFQICQYYVHHSLDDEGGFRNDVYIQYPTTDSVLLWVQSQVKETLKWCGSQPCLDYLKSVHNIVGSACHVPMSICVFRPPNHIMNFHKIVYGKYALKFVRRISFWSVLFHYKPAIIYNTQFTFYFSFS